MASARLLRPPHDLQGFSSKGRGESTSPQKEGPDQDADEGDADGDEPTDVDSAAARLGFGGIRLVMPMVAAVVVLLLVAH